MSKKTLNEYTKQPYTSICTVPFHLQASTTIDTIHPAGKPTWMLRTTLHKNFKQPVPNFRKKNHTFRNSEEYDIVSITSYNTHNYKISSTGTNLYHRPIWK